MSSKSLSITQLMGLKWDWNSDPISCSTNWLRIGVGCINLEARAFSHASLISVSLFIDSSPEQS